MKFKDEDAFRMLTHEDLFGDRLQVSVKGGLIYIEVKRRDDIAPRGCVQLTLKQLNKIVRKTRNEIEDQTQCETT